MKLILALMAAHIFAGSAFALTATNLAAFEGVEEPVVKYLAPVRQFVPDTFTNITCPGHGIVRMALRYNGDWWDGDRDRHDTSRQRAEVKGIGPHQLPGELFEYATTWRTSTNFFGSGQFCHIFQLKAVDGDDGPPLVTLSILGGTSNACVHYWSGRSRSFKNVRSFHWRPGVWQNIRIRIKTSAASDGEILVSINGDEFQGIQNVPVYRPGATGYRPKWGLYRGIGRGLPLGESYVEHQNASAQKM